jgi:hypothetical protein
MLMHSEFVGNELLIDQSTGHDELLKSIEIVRSFIHGTTAWNEKNPTGLFLISWITFRRLNNYGNTVEIARLGNGQESA